MEFVLKTLTALTSCSVIPADLETQIEKNLSSSDSFLKKQN
jgi:hypothetical protein